MRQLEGGVAVERRARALQAAHPAPAVREEGGVRDHAGAGRAGPGRRGLQRRGGPERASSAAASATRSRRASFSTAASPTRTSWAPASASRSSSTPAATARSTASRTPIPYTTIDGVSRTLSLDLSQRHAVHVVRLATSTPRRSAAGLNYGYPITEFQYIQFGVSTCRAPSCSPAMAARVRPSTG